MKLDDSRDLDDQSDEFVGVLTSQGVKQNIAEAIADMRAERDPPPTVTHVIKTSEGNIITQVTL